MTTYLIKTSELSASPPRLQLNSPLQTSYAGIQSLQAGSKRHLVFGVEGGARAGATVRIQ